MQLNNENRRDGSFNVLMMAHVLRNLPTAQHNAWVCSAGSKGYCAVKEMLQNGIPGHTLLIESGDLRDVDSASNDLEGCCLLVDCFPNGSDFDCLHSERIPNSVSHVTVYTNGIRIPRTTAVDVLKGFLEGCAGLAAVDLSPISRILEVQVAFLARCTGLTALDLSPLSQVTMIHGLFLSGCTGLTALDLSPLSRLTEISAFFLAGCAGLTSLDLSPLSQVSRIQRCFLPGCASLTTLDLSPPSQLAVQWGFLKGCSGLTALDLSPLSQVTEVTTCFLESRVVPSCQCLSYRLNF